MAPAAGQRVPLAEALVGMALEGTPPLAHEGAGGADAAQGAAALALRLLVAVLRLLAVLRAVLAGVRAVWAAVRARMLMSVLTVPQRAWLG